MTKFISLSIWLSALLIVFAVGLAYIQNHALAQAPPPSGQVKIQADVLPLTEQGQLIAFITDRPWYEWARVPFTTTFENSGQASLVPTGQITIRNWFGKESARLNVNEKGTVVVTNVTAQIPSFWARPSYLGLGKYSAVLNLYYGAGGFTASQVTFWIIPWKIILAVILIIIAVIIYRYRKKQSQKNQPEKQKFSPRA